MRLTGLLFNLVTVLTVAQALTVPGVDTANPQAAGQVFKRKGGGGGGGKGGGGGTSSGSSRGGSTGATGSTGSRGGTTGGGSPSTGGGGSASPASGGGGIGASRGGLGSPSSNIGGSTRQGSGAPRAFGGGQYYGGGARTPYRSGLTSPRGIAPVFFVAAALAFWPGVWLYGAHMYPYHHPYSYYNRTAAENQTSNVLCGCDPHLPCACDDDNNTALIQNLVGDGADYNRSLLQVATVNGTRTLLLNGSLPNGTTSPGGEDDAFDSSAAAGMRGYVEALGFWPMVAVACATVLLV